jgi:hypothetical protein
MQGRQGFTSPVDRKIQSLGPMIQNPAPRTCPACGHSFIPWRVWRISHWSCIDCRACGALLNRKIDLQFLSVYFTFAVFLTASMVLLVFSLLASIGSAAVAALGIWLTDAYTVRLCLAGPWAGWWRGYEG